MLRLFKRGWKWMCCLMGLLSTPGSPVGTAVVRRPSLPSSGSPADGPGASGGRDHQSQSSAPPTVGVEVGQGAGKRDASETLDDDETHDADQNGNHKPDEAAEPRAGATMPERASSGSPPGPPPDDPPGRGEPSSPASSADDESTLGGAGASGGRNREDESPRSTSPGGQGAHEPNLPEMPEADGAPEEDQADDGKRLTEPQESGPSSAASGDGGPTRGLEDDTDGHGNRDGGEESARSKGPKKGKRPRRFGGRRTGITQNVPVKRASFNPRPELICRKTPGSVRWEIALSADDSATSVKQNGEPLSLRNGSWPLACFAGHLSIDFKEGSPVTVPLFDQNPLIFKLKKDWGGDGRRVPRVTKGHFIVIAPVEWGVPSGHAPVDPEGCSDPTFMAHYFFRDGKESESDLGGFPGHDVPSSAPEFTLSGRTVFDDSAEGNLFVGKPPQLIAADRVLWARVGEEGENGWKGRSFQPSECSLAEVMDARQGRFFLRVYDKQVAMLDGAQFRYLRDLGEIQVNGEPYSEDTLLVPSAAGYPPTSVRFVGIDGSPIHASQLPGPAAVVNEMGDLIAAPRPEADAVSCTLIGDGGRVDIALRLPRIWWRMERDDGDGEWCSTPLMMTRHDFREHADANAVLRLRSPKRISSVCVGFGDEPDIKYMRKDGEFALPLANFVDHVEIDRHMAEETRFNAGFDRSTGVGQTVLTLVQIAADPPPGPVRRPVAKVRRGGGGWRPGKGFSHREVHAADQLASQFRLTREVWNEGGKKVPKGTIVELSLMYHQSGKQVARLSYRGKHIATCFDDELRKYGRRVANRRATGKGRRLICIDRRRRSKHPANVETLGKKTDV